MNIRKMLPSDIECVLPFIKSMYLEHQKNLPDIITKSFDEEYTREQLHNILQKEGLSHFVYTIDDRVVAYLELSSKIYTTNLIFPNEKSLYVELVVVDPNNRRQGIAKKLLSFSKDYAIQHEYDAMVLDVVHNMSHLIKLYEDFGFSPVWDFMKLNLK